MADYFTDRLLLNGRAHRGISILVVMVSPAEVDGRGAERVKQQQMQGRVNADEAIACVKGLFCKTPNRPSISTLLLLTHVNIVV
jgi:hypothetical protein